MTRGRETNVAHLVAEDLDDARQQWIETFSRDRADLGPGHAAMRAAEDLERYAPHRPLEAALGDLRAAWSTQQDLRNALPRAERQHKFMAGYGDSAYAAEFQAAVDELRDELATATAQVHTLLREPALRSLPPGRVKHERDDWLQDRQAEQQLAAEAHWEERNNPRPRPGRPPYGYQSPPDPGRGISR